jgi:hypothetical protein
MENLYYIKYLKEVMGFAIIFTSNCKLSDEDKQKLKPYTYKIVERANVGRDFGAYKFAILHFKEEVKSANLFLIANDSVYGPIQDLTPFLRKMEEGYEVVSDMLVDESIYGHPIHLTSYFVLMNKTVTNSQRFLKFWQKKVKYISNRASVINNGEIAFSYYCLKFFNTFAFIDGFKIQNSFEELDSKKKDLIFISSKIQKDFETTGKVFLKTLAPNHFPYLVLKNNTFFVKRDWVKKFIREDFLSKIIEEVSFSTDIDKKFLLKQIKKDSFLDKKTLKLMKKNAL